jgi:hypothetical protein
MIDYVTQQDRRRFADLYREAKDVWASLRDSERVKGASEVHLGPTSAKSEYQGLGRYLMPTYWCCVSTYITVKKNEAGDWQFWQEACADR